MMLTHPRTSNNEKFMLLDSKFKNLLITNSIGQNSILINIFLNEISQKK